MILNRGLIRLPDNQGSSLFQILDKDSVRWFAGHRSVFVQISAPTPFHCDMLWWLLPYCGTTKDINYFLLVKGVLKLLWDQLLSVFLCSLTKRRQKSLKAMHC